MGIINPTRISQREYHCSREITKPLVKLILMNVAKILQTPKNMMFCVSVKQSSVMSISYQMEYKVKTLELMGSMTQLYKNHTVHQTGAVD